MRRWRIAYVVHDYHRAGGHSRYVAELATRLSPHHEVHVFANRFQEEPDANIRFHHVPAWRATALTSILTFVVPATLKVRRGFDIVHSQGFCALGAGVVTAHICNSSWYAAQKALGRVDWKQAMFHRIVTPLERSYYRHAHDSWVIAISNNVQRDLSTLYRCDSPCEVIYHGVNLDQFNPADRRLFREKIRKQWGIRADAGVALFVGDLRKGALDVLAALKEVPEAVGLFVSRTPPDPFRKASLQLGVAERAVFCPGTERIEEFYGAADAFVFPTPYDAFGMVISEAMACGLPVITTRNAGAAELIEHGTHGYLLEGPGNGREIARYLRVLLLDEPLRAGIGRAARAKAEEYSWDRITNETVRVYERFLARNGS